MSKIPAATSLDPGEGQAEALDNVGQVLEYLTGEGYKISRAGLYKHVSQGLLRPDDQGRYQLRQVGRYAKTHLPQKGTGLKRGEQAQRQQERKAAAEITRIETQTRLLRLKEAKEAGRLVARDDLEDELVARAVVLDNSFRHQFQAKAHDLVAIVRGQQTLAGDLAAALCAILAEQMNEYARPLEFIAVLPSIPIPVHTGQNEVD